MSKSLVSRRLRTAVREHLVGWTLGAIDDLFMAEGFTPASPPQEFSGQRRHRVEEFYAGIRWEDGSQVRAFLRVVEVILTQDQDAAEPVLKTLRLDGFHVDGRGRIVTPTEGALLDAALDGLLDPAVIEQHLARIMIAIEGDPEGAIGASKELVESLTKQVLQQLGEEVDERKSLPQLARSAQRALGIASENVAPTKKGAEVIGRTLQNLAGLVDGVAELRNLYGTGHGRATRVGGLAPRHARLTASAAQAYCRFMVDTLVDPHSPWKGAQQPDPAGGL